MKQPFEFKCRGLGKDFINRCFCCGIEMDGVADNVSAFVKTQKEGQHIVDNLFKGLARLDFRDFEPNWIQVKIGSCEECIPALKELQRLCRAGDIYARDVTLAKRYGKQKGNISK